jgi:hypothetical protein
MFFARRRIFAVVTPSNSRYLSAVRTTEQPSRSIATMANKASLKPAEDFLEFVNASPTRMPLPQGEPRIKR